MSVNTGTPIVTFPHNLKNPDQLLDRLISLGCATNIDSNNYDNIRTNIAEWIKDFIQGPPNARYSKDQIIANVNELSSRYKTKYQDTNYKVKNPEFADTNKWLVKTKKNNVGKTISNIFVFAPTSFRDLLEDDYTFNLGSLTDSILTPDASSPFSSVLSNIKVAAWNPINSTANNITTTLTNTPTGATTAVSGAVSEENIDPAISEQEALEKQKKKLEEFAEAAKEGAAFLKNIEPPYFVKNDYNTELGIIGNIMVNVKMLYDLSIDDNLASQDKKEKKEISLYDFIKNTLSKISPVIGNVNNFDIIADEKNNAQIVDINFVGDPAKVFQDAFEIQLHNLHSVVRSYKLESKIFPEQSNIIAVGAQNGGGALGTDTTTFVAYNRSVRDRIIPVKTSPSEKAMKVDKANEKLKAILSNLETLYKFFGRLKPGIFVDADFDVDKAGDYENALRDLINDLKSIIASKTNNKAILPTVLSLEMDGIGGLIIGNIFKVNSDVLPKGYKGSGQGGIGPNLGYTITGLGHTVQDGDWVTKIDAQTIILDPPNQPLKNFDYSTISININPITEKDIVLNAKKEIEEINEAARQSATNETGDGGGGSGGEGGGGGGAGENITGGKIDGNYIPLNQLKPSTQAAIKSGDKLVLVREGATSSRTVGTMWYKGQVLGFTVEDAVRTKKIQNQTAPPAGEYFIPLDTTGNDSLKSSYVKFPDSSISKFRNPGVFPRVGTEKGGVSINRDGIRFEGVRIHRGYTERSSAGCIIYSSKRNKDGSVKYDIEHNKALTRLVYANKIGKLLIINEFQKP